LKTGSIKFSSFIKGHILTEKAHAERAPNYQYLVIGMYQQMGDDAEFRGMLGVGM
jgi:hypothetical protein